MFLNLDFIINILELGFIYSLVVLAVHLSSGIIRFDDLSIEGSFATGGALTAVLVSHGISSWLAIFFALCIGMVVGVVTGLLHTKLKLNNLISGIVVTTALFSLNLKMAGANITLPLGPTMLDVLPISFLQPWSHLFVLLFMSVSLVCFVAWFLKTEIGFLLRALGSNQRILTILGKNSACYKILGLSIANSFTALAGALFVLHVGFFSITGSIGTLAIALAGLIIGQVLCRRPLMGVIIGAIGYQAVIAFTIECNFDPVWNKLVTAVLIVVLIALRNNIKIKG